jgi:hypothetical protein
MSSKRERQARYRERQRELVVVVPVEITLDDTLWLESEGFLPALLEQDREAIAKAIARLIALSRKR